MHGEGTPDPLDPSAVTSHPGPDAGDTPGARSALEPSGAGDALAATGVTVREAGDGDEVAGVRPRWVALPESAEEIAAVLRACAAHDLAAVATGGRTKLHWAAPPERCDVLVDLGRMNRVLEHTPGDLVVRVQAGVTAEALASALAAENQELALDVPVPGTTVGGLLATGIAGPRGFRHGTARDLLIGITVVLADGTIARSGGKVVKNVAGYDLGKLFTGSYGTLGIIADATFRLRPLPAARAWVTASVGRPVTETATPYAYEGQTLDTTSTDVAAALRAMVPAITESPLEPSAVEVDWPDVDGPCWVAVLVEGSAAAERAKALSALMGGTAEVSEQPPPWWGRLPEPDDTLLELRVGASSLLHLLPALRDAAHASGAHPVIRGSLAAGILHIGLRGTPGEVAGFVGLVRDDAEGTYDGRVVVLCAPVEAARRLDRWGRVGALPLMRRVKERFDPGRRLSPGRFVGGI
ncbi:FAD-binding oxidoreductase [Microbispora amethystogenes]|uniref:FAD-linked oxidase n=1 Tax=Microbispora amethystogenes TaxID=1427754 RepID=A0ABQ4FL67_9ACTN|nr:FAD-binding oxidoreductase [Microbispora amethystogenes]GIH35540.1 FAD-linked oxidase [Microbispora amethystogenes]